VSRPWRIREITTDFRLEDVWRLPWAGGPGDFAHLIDTVAEYDPAQSASWPLAALFRLRWKLGEILGWDAPGTGLGDRVATLRERLPDDLRATPGPSPRVLPFTSLYQTEDEWAIESANQTMHGILHLGRVPAGDGGFGAQMAIYVKPNGLLGMAYMALIKPFRYLVVYPRMMREMAHRLGA
jgi:hypothetical protein